MPSNVRNFMLLCYLGLAVGAITCFFTFDTNVKMAAAQGGAGFVIAVQAISMGLLFVLVTLASFGRKNWARWVLLILYVLGLPLAIWTFPTVLRADLAKAATSFLQAVIQAVALYLIFTGNAKTWFRKDQSV